MASKLLFYLVLLPLSRLPFWCLYRLSDVFFLTIYYLVPYRKKVVRENIKRSFPNKNKQEIDSIVRRFYRHFCDIIVESIKLFSISDQAALARCQPNDTVIFERLYAEGRSAIIVGGHYNNWELTALRFRKYVPHRCFGIYTPLSNVFLNEKIQTSRTRFGLELIPVKNVKPALAALKDEPSIIIFGADQSPARHSKKHYWTQFLNQETAVFYGCEKYAKQYNMPVFFAKITKVRRGFYRFDLELIEENPIDTPYGEITEKHVQLLEQQILTQPEFWLWTHKRWKIKKTEQA